GVKSYLSIPMSYAKTLIGFVGFTSESEEKYWSEDTIKLLNVVGEIFTNALERKRSEETLYLSEERFFKVFNASPGMMTITSYQDGRVINVNNTFLEIFGDPVERVVGKNILDLDIWFDVEDRATVMDLLNEHGTVRNMEIKYKTVMGEVRTGLFSAEKIELDSEQCILGIINDVTELIQLEQEITRLDRLNLVGKMAASIAHEIRNPLTAVQGFIQILRDKKEYTKDRENFDLMIDELDRAKEILSEYLSLAANKPINDKKQNLNSIIMTLNPMLTADADIWEKNIDYQLEDIPDILVDEKEIRQLLLNLVCNGLEAMEQGNTLTIRTFVENNHVVLAVQDQGKGIDQMDFDKIGTPFYTTKDHGTGLGLAVCYSIAARHKAEVTFETGPSGTTFYVRFNSAKNHHKDNV
ncbi:MAG: ATP-binding protein, partial [Desulfitobacteriaceae bacterium]|nr:ATP-binding protein [Desulfitobacteriaceae bacterium]